MSAQSRGSKKAAIIPSEAAAQALAQYCPDLSQWPGSWRGDDSDIARGQRIVDYFTPFLLHLLAQSLSPKTKRKHRDHLWMLGGEVIRHLHDYPERRRWSIDRVFAELIDGEGGPLIWPRITEQEQNSFDGTCRKLYKFVTANKI